MTTAAAALSTLPDTESAYREVAGRVGSMLEGMRADLAVIFASSDHGEALGSMAERRRAGDLAEHVIGCTGESIVGEGREIEGGPALALWAIRLPGARVHPFRASGNEALDALPIRPGDDPSPTRAMLLLGDPFTFPIDDWLAAVNERHPGLPIVGGMASGAAVPGRNRLVVDDEILAEGAVGALIDGSVAVQTVVSQGCRPIGRPMIVTQADRNVVLELGRRPTIEVLKELLDSLPPEDVGRARNGLHLGRAMSEYRDEFRRGDFLIRNVIGLDPRGGIAITDMVRVGQTVQFHVRDADTADEDLRALLAVTGPERPVCALLFTCNGRGTRLFPDAGHDAAALADSIGPIPACGFFAMGELGPVGGRNFLHGFTASIALFGPATLDES